MKKRTKAAMAVSAAAAVYGVAAYGATKVLICVMLATNNPQAKAFFQKLLPHRRAVAEKEEN